ncbi:methyltransferase domain-containing protein [Candidatus Gracilibacteria bacterium]|nr:methyltransferase domain-containing protein [Candidatus Gracilibacteria bacterium]
MQIEALVAEGLEPIARQELRSFDRPIKLLDDNESGPIRFEYNGGVRALFHLRTITSLYLVSSYAVPRPRGLLGDENLRRLVDQINTVRSHHPPEAFTTLYVSAAGAETAVLQRLKEELASRCDLTIGEDDGDLLLRLRRSVDGEGWEVLTRLTPRPLATRKWRVCNMEGALNGTAAYTMAMLTRPHPNDLFLNIGCGSGTLLIERLFAGEARRAIGCDNDSEALACARQNIVAAGMADRCELHSWDARALPLPDGASGAICGDLPFGHLVGSHDENLRLYPALLDEAARVAQPRALGVFLSHELRLMERYLDTTRFWHLERAIKVGLGGLYPRIFILRRV